LGSTLGQILSSAANTPGEAERLRTGAEVAMGHSSIPCEAGPAKAQNSPTQSTAALRSHVTGG